MAPPQVLYVVAGPAAVDHGGLGEGAGETVHEGEDAVVHQLDERLDAAACWVRLAQQAVERTAVDKGKITLCKKCLTSGFGAAACGYGCCADNRSSC